MQSAGPVLYGTLSTLTTWSYTVHLDYHMCSHCFIAPYTGIGLPLSWCGWYVWEVHGTFVGVCVYGGLSSSTPGRTYWWVVVFFSGGPHIVDGWSLAVMVLGNRFVGWNEWGNDKNKPQQTLWFMFCDMSPPLDSVMGLPMSYCCSYTGIILSSSWVVCYIIQHGKMEGRHPQGLTTFIRPFFDRCCFCTLVLYLF